MSSPINQIAVLVASLPGTAARISVPIVLLIGSYFAENRVWRVLCGVGLALWMGCVIVAAIITEQWNVLVFPALVVVFWAVISEVKKTVD